MRISHFGVHNAEANQPVAVNANAGDTLLFQATRDLFVKFLGPVDWKLEALWKEMIAEINKQDAVLVGGGGLFLRDQKGADASRSGWQWNCSVDELKQITAPLIIFGVGYNRFRNQPDFDPVFTDHVHTMVEKSIFFGLRNHGSRYAIRRYLPTSLHHKVLHQPCPTTLSAYLYPELVKTPVKKKTLVLNAAFDRREMRMGADEKQILGDIADVVSSFAARGWKIILANHKPQDAEIGELLVARKVPFEAVDLSAAYPEEILKFYADKDVTVGMRGHAQMIPFGLQRKIVSIVSHDKMGWFLDDIQHPEWGVDVEDLHFKEKLLQALTHVSEHPDIERQLAEAQEKLWAVTTHNMQGFRKN